MESSTAQFLWRQFACVQLPNKVCVLPEMMVKACSLQGPPKHQPPISQLGGVASLCHPSGGWLVEFRLLCYVLLTA